MIKRPVLSKTLAILAVSAFLTVIGVNYLPASDEQEMPDVIVFDQEICGKNLRGPVEFTHLNHAEDYELSCSRCHHDYIDGKNIWEEGNWVNKCIECHDPCDSDGNVKKLKVAMHRNCIECHRKLKKEWGSTDAPYKACKDCHER